MGEENSHPKMPGINWNGTTSCQEVIAGKWLGILFRDHCLSHVAWVHPLCHLRGAWEYLVQKAHVPSLRYYAEYLQCARHRSIVANKRSSGQMNLVWVRRARDRPARLLVTP